MDECITAKDFPRLAETGYTETSPRATAYNCIAWAAGDQTQWWWPHPDDDFWPADVPRTPNISSFIHAFGVLGYQPCPNGDYEAGVEKVALYADLDGEPTHAARQIGPNEWTSKLGDCEDITHTLAGLEGPFYGTVRQFLKRPKS